MITHVLATSLPNLSNTYDTVTVIYAFMHMNSYKCPQVYVYTLFKSCDAPVIKQYNLLKQNASLSQGVYIYCGFINIRGVLFSWISWFGLIHEIKCQRTSNSRRLFITEIQKPRNKNATKLF